MSNSTHTTIRDVARELQLSHTTVSRVLNDKGKGFISVETRRRVMEAVARMNYRPHRAARALATGRTGMIGLWIEDLRQPYVMGVVNHVLSLFNDPGVDLVIRTMRNVEAMPLAMAQWQVDGILVLDGVDYVRSLVTQDLAACPPLVAMGDPPEIEVDHVGVDLFAGAVAAVQHLIDVGCRRIAFFTGPWGNRQGEGRYDGYASVLQAAGCDAEVIVMPNIDPAATRASARLALRAYIERHGCPDGLFCLSDIIAISAYRALLDLGIRVPDDVAIVGCDGLQETEYMACPLTTIVQPFEAMSLLAWQFLQERLDEPARPIQKRILSPHLVVRESSRR